MPSPVGVVTIHSYVSMKSKAEKCWNIETIR